MDFWAWESDTHYPGSEAFYHNHPDIRLHLECFPDVWFGGDNGFRFHSSVVTWADRRQHFFKTVAEHEISFLSIIIVILYGGGWWVVGGGWWVVGWRSCLTQCCTVTEVKHGRARSGVGWVTAQVIDQ